MSTSVINHSSCIKRIGYLLCFALILLPAASALAYGNSASFTGQGIAANGSGGYNLNTEICGTENGAQVNGPYILWVLTASGADNADITGPWGTAAMTKSGGGSFKYVSGWYNLSTLLPGVVSATYDGDPKNVQLVISHGCGACTPPPAPSPSANGPSCIGSDPISVALTAGTGADSYSWTGPDGFSSSDQNPTATITAAGSYTYALTVTVNGCTSAAGTTTIVVNAIPGAPSPTNDGPHCFYSNPTTAQLHANATADSYSWSGPDGWTSSDADPTVSLTAPGSYDYTLTITVNGCTSDAGKTTVVINQPPAVSVIAGGPTTFCLGGSVTLSAVATGNGPFSYQWSNGATTASVVASAAGAYSVTVTDANGCSTSSGSVVVTTLYCACSLTQGAYGSTGGAGSVSQVSSLIGSGLTVGFSTRAFKLVSTDAPCFVLRMPAGGQPAILPVGPTAFTSGYSTCSQNNASLVSKGKFTDVLMGQTFTLSLNVRQDTGLANVPLCANMQTQKLLGNVPDPSSAPVAFTMPASVINWLNAHGGANVGNLLALANQALGGATGLPSLSDVNTAVNNVNVYFDGCRAEVSCQ